MRITADTNVLVRAVVSDDPAQSTAAIAALRGAEQIAVALPALCEFVWVLRRVYAFSVADIVAAIRALMAAGNVSLDRAAVELGLLQLEAGGDFADAVIAHEGQWLGGDTFLSFDRQAVALLQQQGIAAELLR
ncbi:type II toxin-antitoxin system VapC family toxin [Synechococcus sp. CCAP 1479/9]|uniref:type II toxin-antitoxin system VapC family toxin n=1 Tax=Synechococcus sp. CCAP 1479/9 TaxID=1221593 RepID=UPI001C22171E|nr:type II toxin-antitoxin system VapC family toxin [Synechococcus sp. CCAP 1479/9]